MKIGIISDSHKKLNLLKKAIKILKNADAKYLIHAGDIISRDALEILHNANLPYRVVFGNNDLSLIKYQSTYNIYNEPHYFNIKDISIKLMHLPYYMKNDANLIIYGHTHYFKAEVFKGSLYINPGEICARKKPISEFALVETDSNNWYITHFQKIISDNEKDYHTKNITLPKEEKNDT